MVFLCVDDLLVTGSNNANIVEFKSEMQDVFEMSKMCKMSYFLGMEVEQTGSGIAISQKNIFMTF